MPRSKKQVKNLGLLDTMTHAKKYVVEKIKGKTVITPVYARKRKKTSKAQEEGEERFKDAIAYASHVIKDPKRKAAYEKKLKGKRNAFQAAVSEYMRGEEKW